MAEAAAGAAAAVPVAGDKGKKPRQPNEKEFKDKMAAWSAQIEALEAEMVCRCRVFRPGAGVFTPWGSFSSAGPLFFSARPR